MVKKNLYDRTVGILVDAYMNDTLVAGNCAACACGNLVAANNNYTISVVDGADWWARYLWVDKNGEGVIPFWGRIISQSCIMKHYGVPIVDNFFEWKSVKEVRSTGYRINDFMKIEKAFENGYKAKKGDRQFNALCAVIDVLDKIHDNKDAALTVQTKKRFNKHVNQMVY